jgi:hypothetical protein
MSEMTREQAIELAETGWWKDRKPEDIVSFQLFEEKLCMDFGDFQMAVEKVLGHPVWTHEFAYPDSLRKEFLKERPAPTFSEILAIIPEAKRIVIVAKEPL